VEEAKELDHSFNQSNGASDIDEADRDSLLQNSDHKNVF
jgi:hypothetical protein